MSNANSNKDTKWKAENPEKVREQKRKWYQKHKDEIAKKQAMRHAADPTPKRSRNRAWKAANGYKSDRRVFVVDGKLSPGLIEKLLKLQRGMCACCKRPLGNKFHLDHILPLSLGGLNEDANMQLLRPLCNLQKHASHPVDFMQRRGFLL